jgi:hypothetical protein
VSDIKWDFVWQVFQSPDASWEEKMTWKVALDETLGSVQEVARLFAVPIAQEMGASYPDSWWDDRHWNALRESGKFSQALSKITVDVPPDHATTLKEASNIVKLQGSGEFNVRRPEIIEEADAPPPYFLQTFFLDQLRRPRSAALFEKSVTWAVPFIMHFKHRWKRPRPTQIEPRISPVVVCPCHPAYPSGHSTQAHLVALVLGDLSNQTNVKKALWDKADRIAQNREYAGLHYESDSAAGAKLAESLFPEFQAQFGHLMDEARGAEWR